MIDGNFQALAFLLGAMGLAVAAIALIVAVEVARRSQEYLREHAQDMSLTLSRRISEQDKYLSDSLGRIRQQIAEAEKSTRLHLKELREISGDIDRRFMAQDAYLSDQIDRIDGKLLGLAKTVAAHQDRLLALKRRLDAPAGNGGALRPGGAPDDAGTARPAELVAESAAGSAVESADFGRKSVAAN